MATEPPPRRPMTDANARPRPGVEPCLTSRWTPRYAWTLHLVPGRLDGPPLAVRRRVLEAYADLAEIETPTGTMTVSLDHEYGLHACGVTRGFGTNRLLLSEEPTIANRYFGFDLALVVFDHNPTEAERAAWLQARLVEQAFLKALPSTVWHLEPGPYPGAPNRAVEYRVRPELGSRPDEYAHRGDLRVNGVRSVPTRGQSVCTSSLPRATRTATTSASLQSKSLPRLADDALLKTRRKKRRRLAGRSKPKKRRRLAGRPRPKKRRRPAGRPRPKQQRKLGRRKPKGRKRLEGRKPKTRRRPAGRPKPSGAILAQAQALRNPRRSALAPMLRAGSGLTGRRQRALR